MAGRPIAIKQIAEDLSISPTTVSRALSGKGRVAESTKEAVLNYVKEKGVSPSVYRPDYTSKVTKNILITVAGEKDYGLLPYFSQVIMGAYDYFEPLGYQIMVAKTSAEDIEPLKKIIKSHKCDGVILSRTIENALDIRFLQENNVPFVVIGSYDDSTVYQVDVNQRDGCCELTGRLLDQGLRKIALFCGDMTHVVTRSRMKGFMQAYDDHEIDFDCTKIYDSTGYIEVAESRTLQMLKEGMECIICMDDNICLNVLNVLRKYKAWIPSDIKVASFYNSQALEEHYPPISCVKLDITSLSKAASEMLYHVLMKEEVLRRGMLGYEVLMKDSTKM